MANGGLVSPITQALYGGPAYGVGGLAPVADMSGVSAWTGGDPGANPANNIGAQQSAIGLAQQTAQGKGPSAAADMLKAQTAKTQANTNALASSAPGRNQAEARRTAMLVGSNASQDLGAQAAAARSREQLGGESLYGQLAGEGRAQDIENAKLAETAGMGQANLQLGQNQLNQQAYEFQTQQNSQVLGQMAGLAAGAALAFADGDVGANPNADFVEPPGKTPRPAMVSLREITGPDANPMLIMVNQQTGKIQRVAGTDLTPEEMACVQRPHGAGPLDANAPGRQHAQMADGDVGSRPGEGTNGPMGFRAPQPMQPKPQGPAPKKSFADVVREAHAGLYTVPEGHQDPMGGGSFRSDENEPRTRRAASAAGNAVGSVFNDGDVTTPGAPSDNPFLGPNAPTTSVVGYAPSAPKNYMPDPTAGIDQSATPSDSDFYYSNMPGANKEADYAKANQLASNTAQGPSPQATGGYDQGWDDTIRANGGSAPGDPDTQSDSSGGGENKFFKALGGALAGYSNPKNVGALYNKRPVYKLQDTGTPQYNDGDLNAQLDQAHKAEMTRGPTTVMVSREGDNESPVTKSSPVAEQSKPTAHIDVYPIPRPDASTDATVTDFAARDGSDPYKNLPQGLETTTTIGENSLMKNYMRGNPTQFSPFLSHDEAEGGVPKHMAVEEKSRAPQPEVPYDKRLPGMGYYSSTYMDGDVSSDPFVPTKPSGRDVSYGYSARKAFDDDIASLRSRLDAEDAATKADKGYRAPSVDATGTNMYYPATKKPEKLPANPYKDADLTSKFAARPSRKRKSGKR